MANFLARIRNAEFNSRLARSLLSRVYREGKVYRIYLGPLRGFRLHYERGVNFHAVLGLWDLATFRFLRSALSKGGYVKERMLVADVGANIGLFSLWASRFLTGKMGRVFAFEPAETTRNMLATNTALNHVHNIEIVGAACADREGTIDFYKGHHHHTSSLCPEWAAFGGPIPEKTSVPCTTLDAFFGGSQRQFPNLIKIDIEGGGCYALKGIDKCVEMNRPLIWMESHTPEEDRSISELIVRTDYSAFRFQTRTFVKNHKTTHPDTNGVWGTLLLFPQEQYSRILTAVG